ncbi:S41 family peptidase [Novispirillum itersonii]|uniref:S41 family peptidase n=1 Tax=Novispirillum itersonii TaxID=189 RepID=UPI0003646841|nr:S41 family peptidase [Novispirillum itersonii]
MMRKSLIAACAVAALSFGAGVAFQTTVSAPALAETKGTENGSNEDIYRLLDLFGNVFERVRRDYVEPVTDQQLIEAAINGMLSSLDPHSSYLNADNYKDMQVQTKGEFGGLGIEVSMENGLVKVVSPIDDTPAFRAGLQPGDLISHLDGKPVLGLSLQDAVEQMRGKVGTAIKLTIRREGKQPFDVSLTRDVIQIKSARWHREGDIGYIRLTAFNEKTYDGLKEGVEKMRKEIGNDKLRGFVLDLRNNPGGLLDQAISVSDAFLDAGEIVSTRSRNAEDTQRYNARKGDLIDGLPLVVLINDGSASASEIVAGALQDHRRAIIVGTKSFGKGSVQTIIPLAGHGAMRLTTARYYTPSGRSIQAVGIEPDIEVRQLKLADGSPEPHRRAEADLPKALKNPNAPASDKKDADPKAKDAKPAPEAEDDGVDVAPAPGPDGKVEDYQLSRALDILRGVAIFRERQTTVQ